ncbi:MAG: efflux RND transporter periplasmic adaptor subunit [Deltaproteobacteria bacterium]|nr:efflux RND transporter periplasmic adaptor subunit [Deltaproteobacteria bacterium]
MEPTQSNGASDAEVRAATPSEEPLREPSSSTHGGHVIHEPPTFAKRIAALVALLVVLVLGGAVVVRMQGAMADQAQIEADRGAAAAAANEAPEVDVVHPVPGQLTPLVVLSGALEPAQSADLGFEVPGRIARVDVQLGQTVRAGTVLGTLDRASIGAQASASQAAIGVAEANVAMLRERVELLRTLASSGAAPERDLTSATQQLAIAEAQVRQAQAGSRAVSTSVADHTLHAPFNGVVTRVPDGVGQVVAPGLAVFHVEDLSSLTLRTTVSQTELEALRQGMPAVLEGSNASGTITSLVRSLDASSRRAPAEVVIPNADGRLVAHALVRARVATGAPIPAVRIPPSARRSDGSVLVVTASGVIEARTVEAQSDLDGTWLVPVGLTVEDQVVVRAAMVRAGATVRAHLTDGAAPAVVEGGAPATTGEQQGG